MFTYYVWYSFTYFKQIEPMYGEKNYFDMRYDN